MGSLRTRMSVLGLLALVLVAMTAPVAVADTGADSLAGGCTTTYIAEIAQLPDVGPIPPPDSPIQAYVDWLEPAQDYLLDFDATVEFLQCIARFDEYEPGCTPALLEDLLITPPSQYFQLLAAYLDCVL